MAVQHHDEQDEDKNEDTRDILTTQNNLHISYICIAPSESLGAHLSSGVLVDLLVHSAPAVSEQKAWSSLEGVIRLIYLVSSW